MVSATSCQHLESSQGTSSTVYSSSVVDLLRSGGDLSPETAQVVNDRWLQQEICMIETTLFYNVSRIFSLSFMEEGAGLTCGFLVTCLLAHSVVVNFHSVELNVVSACDFHPGELGSYLSPHLDSQNKHSLFWIC